MYTYLYRWMMHWCFFRAAALLFCCNHTTLSVCFILLPFLSFFDSVVVSPLGHSSELAIMLILSIALANFRFHCLSFRKLPTAFHSSPLRSGSGLLSRSSSSLFVSTWTSEWSMLWNMQCGLFFCDDKQNLGIICCLYQRVLSQKKREKKNNLYT